MCGELELHTHDKKCYDKDGKLICGKPELLEHIHGAECFREVEMTDEEVAALNGTPVEEAERPEDVSAAAEADAPADDDEAGEIGTMEETAAGETAPANDAAAVETVPADDDAAAEIDPADAAAAVVAGPADAAAALADALEDKITSGETASEGETAAGEATPTDLPAEEATSTDLPTEEATSTDLPDEDESDEQNITKVYRDKEIEVTAEYTAAANLPEEAELRVRLATQEDIAEARKGEDASEAEDDEDSLFYVIGFYVGDKEIEPEAPVSVKMRFLDGQFKDEENLSVEHYTKEGKEEFLPEVQKDEEGNAEAAFTTSSFSVYKFGAAKSTGQRVTEDTEILNCGVCNGECNIIWTVRSDGTAKVSGMIQKKDYYHIHDHVTYKGVDYQVTDLSYIQNDKNCDGDTRVAGSKVEIDDELAQRMTAASFSIPNPKQPEDVAQQMEEEGFLPGDGNNGSAKLWKKARYISNSNQAEIILRYYQEVKNPQPLDLIFVFDDSKPMWGGYCCCSKNRAGFQRNDCSAQAGLYQRIIVQEMCRQLLNGNHNVRVAFVACSEYQVTWSENFYDNYALAKNWIQSKILKRGSTKYYKAMAEATKLAQASTLEGRMPAVVWLSDFGACLGGTAQTNAEALRKAATGGVYTISFGNICGNESYGYSGDIATIDPQYAQSYKVCCHEKWYDPTHMFLARDAVDIFSAMERSIKNAMGYNISLDTVVWDELSPGIAALDMVGDSGDGTAGRTKDGSKLYWFFANYDEDLEEYHCLEAGTVYEHNFFFNLDGLDRSKVYSGHMPTNKEAWVEQGRTAVNELTQSPRLQKPVELELQRSYNGPMIPNAVFELYEGEKLLWSGTTNISGMASIPYGSGENQALFERGKTYTLKETFVEVPVTCPAGKWELTVGEDYTITSKNVPDWEGPNWDNEPTKPMEINNGRFRVFNFVTLSVYWVMRNPDGTTVTALPKEADNWWGTRLSDMNRSVTIDEWGAMHLWSHGRESTIWTPDTLPVQDDANVTPYCRIWGYGIGPDCGGTLTMAQAREKVVGKSLEQVYTDQNQAGAPDFSMGIEWIRNYLSGTETLQYFRIKDPYIKNHTDEWLDGNIVYQRSDGSRGKKAVYIIYEDLRPLNFTVRKVWNDGGKTVDHSKDKVTFTITPRGGETLTNPETGNTTFTLTAKNKTADNPNVWEKTYSLNRISYSVTETNVKPGYSVTYSAPVTEEDGMVTVTITSLRGVALPNTGGTGTYPYTIGGAAILVGGLLYGLQLRRRREGAAE